MPLQCLTTILLSSINGKSLYPQEWNDFVESKHPDRKLNLYRKRCDELDPQVNCSDPQDAKALPNKPAL
jgi:hypothetical protein